MILCAVACVVTLLLGRKDWKQLLLRFVLLGFAGVCAVVACSEILRQVRQRRPTAAGFRQRLCIMGIRHGDPEGARGVFGIFFGNIETSGFIRTCLFIPWPAVLCIGVLFAGAKPRPPGVRLMGWLAVFFAVFFYVGWIDLPLYPLMGKLYAPNPMAWRGLLSLYLPLWALVGLGASGCCWSRCRRGSAPGRGSGWRLWPR